MKRIVKYLLIASCWLCGVAQAETEMDLAKTTQNPLSVNAEARHISLPFVNYSNFGGAPTQNILDIKPVIPFAFTSTYDLVLRTIIPLTHQPVTNGYINGLGDINPTLFITPATNNWLLWGVGPTVVMPTATNKVLGAGKWSVGPEFVLIAFPSQWTFALLTNIVWSVAGEWNRARVNQFTFDYYITYNFSHGWFITSQPTVTADWVAKPSQRWVIPFGIGAGRTFLAGKQAISVSLQGYYNAVRPRASTKWSAQASIDFLFPDGRTMAQNQVAV
jgi:hypothetical protein